jgi:hypothetical protein
MRPSNQAHRQQPGRHTNRVGHAAGSGACGSACGRPPLGPQFTAPVLATAVHALPLALAGVSRPAGTVVAFIADDGGHETAWYLTRTQGEWELGRTAPAAPAGCELRTTTDGAIHSLVRDAAAPALTWRGDPELAHTVSQARAILGQ